MIRGSDPPRRYVALGDSFSAGAAGSDEPGFADRLAALLRAARPGLEYRNLAVPGARTPEIAGEQLGAALALRPDAVTIVCGGNDALLSVRPDVEAHAFALERALATLRLALPDALIATATVPDLSRFHQLRPRSAARVRAALAAINGATRASAARHGALLLDIAAHPDTAVRGNYAADGFHPSPAASARTAEAFAQLFGIEPAQQEAS
jgi:lysophospholipase L1-like esterase